MVSKRASLSSRTLPAKLLPFLLVLVSVLIFYSMVFAASDIVTKDNLEDAVVGNKTFTQTELEEMDLNEDSQLDVADLVLFHHPVMSFKTNYTYVNESNDTASVKILLPYAYDGTIHYTISGTAESGTDFTPLTGTVSGTGSEYTLLIGLEDDDDFEGIETIVISLLPDSRFRVGINPEHTLYITDNDSVWHCAFQSESLLIGFKIRLSSVDTGEGTSVNTIVLDSGGNEGFPQGLWPGNIVLTNDSLSATIGPIEFSSDQILLGSQFSRTLTFNAVLDENKETRISGTMSDTIVVHDEGEHLSTVVDGTFTMVREPGIKLIEDVELTNHQM